MQGAEERGKGVFKKEKGLCLFVCLFVCLNNETLPLLLSCITNASVQSVTCV